MSTPTIQTKIRKAIEGRVSSLPMAATYPIRWTDGPTFEPEPTDRYLRCTWTPNATQRELIGSKTPHRRPGVLQIDVFLPRHLDSARAVEIAGQVAEHFPADLRMAFHGAKVSVTKAPSVMGVFTDTHHQVPAVIEVEANE